MPGFAASASGIGCTFRSTGGTFDVAIASANEVRITVTRRLAGKNRVVRSVSHRGAAGGHGRAALASHVAGALSTRPGDHVAVRVISLCPFRADPDPNDAVVDGVCTAHTVVRLTSPARAGR